MESNNSVGKEDAVRINRYALIFEMPESDVIEIEQAVSDYSLSSPKEREGSYKDWCDMYDGIHHESTFEASFRNWLACARWINKKQAVQPLSPQSSVGVEEIKDFEKAVMSLGLELPETVYRDFRLRYFKFKEAMTEYSSLMNKENDREIERLKKDLIKRCDEKDFVLTELDKSDLKISQLQQLLSEKEKEIEGLKSVRNSYNEINNNLAENLRTSNGEIEYWKQLAEAAHKLIDHTGWGNTSDWEKYESLKNQKQ